MKDRFTRIALSLLIVLLAALVAEPYIGSASLSPPELRPVIARGPLAESEDSAVHLFETVAPSVVQVVVMSQWAAYDGSVDGAASGFIWDGAGHVVTNNHVVRDAGLVAVRLPSGEVIPADIVGRAPQYDLAVLRLQRANGLPPPIAIGSSADLKVGQAAFAIGNPFGLDQTLTRGIISALKRRLPTAGQREIADVIQTDAAINPGNSGGPLLDSAGRLIGVNTAIFSPSGTNAGVGFAVPVDTVNRVIPQLIRDGRVPTPGIGILAADERLAARLGIEGVMVATTMPGSPAERGGLRGVDPVRGMPGDVIVAANGQAVRRLADLAGQFEQVGVGQPIELTVRRPRGEVSLTVEVIDVGEPGR
jgi:2-alkenal reductase